MEKDNIFKYLFIIFLIITCILSGFLVYDKFMKKTDNTNLNNKENTSRENSYEIFKENFIKERAKKYNEEENKPYFTRNNLKITLDKDGNLYYFDDEPVIIATNVLDFDFLGSGNGGQKVLYFIKEDGTVSSANGVVLTPVNNEITFNKNNLDIENNIGGYKNIIGFQDGIVSVCGDKICSDSLAPMFIDINGNMYNSNIS